MIEPKSTPKSNAQHLVKMAEYHLANGDLQKAKASLEAAYPLIDKAYPTKWAADLLSVSASVRAQLRRFGVEVARTTPKDGWKTFEQGRVNPRRRNPDTLAAANRKVAEKEAALEAAINAPLPRVFSANDRWPREQAIRKARASCYVAVGERDDLATLQRGGKPTRRNPDTLRTIVLAWIDPDGGVEEYLDNWRTAYRRVPLAKTVIWANEGTAEDEGKARAFAKKEGNEVFIFPTTEKDPRGRAGREALAAWKAAEAAKEAARVKAEAKARRRKVVNPKLRRNSADRYEKVKALAERGSTEHERDTAARILAGLRSPAQEARAALDAARAKQAQQVAAAYEVLHELRPGDKVEVIFEPKSSSSPNDKRTVTVTSVQDLGKDQHRHAYTTSGRVMPGIPSGGAIMDYGGGDLYFQATMRTPIKRVISLRVVGVAPKGAALIGAKANPRRNGQVLWTPHGPAYEAKEPTRWQSVEIESQNGKTFSIVAYGWADEREVRSVRRFGVRSSDAARKYADELRRELHVRANPRRNPEPAPTRGRKTSAVMPRQAQAAAEAIGWERALQIVGPAGLSGASQRDLKRLLMVAGLSTKRRNPSAYALAALRADYQEANAEYTGWARIEDRLTDRERRQKEAAAHRVDLAWAALAKAKEAEKAPRPTRRNPRVEVPDGWYNSNYKRKPHRRYHVKVEGPDGIYRKSLITEDFDRAKQAADAGDRSAYVEDQWDRPTPGIVFMTSPALRELRKNPGKSKEKARSKSSVSKVASVKAITEGRPTTVGERGGLGGFTDINAARRYIAYRPGGDITPAVLHYRAKHAAEQGYFDKTVLANALEAEERARGYVVMWEGDFS